jgi:hypothetical protein
MQAWLKPRVCSALRALACAAVMAAVTAIGAGVASAAPANDSFSAAPFVSTTGRIVGNNVGGTTESGETLTCNGAPLGATVWYQFVAPSAGEIHLATFDPVSDFDTTLAISEGATVGTQNFRVCEDDEGISRRSSIHAYSVTAGTTYHIQIGGFITGGIPATGNFALSLTFLSDPTGPRRICASGSPNFFSNACSFGQPSIGPYFTGAMADWFDHALNISQDAAQGGGFILHAVWLENQKNQAGFSWLELNSSAGTATSQNHAFQWERQYAWVEGNTDFPGSYVEHHIKSAAADGIQRWFQIQWDPEFNSWGLWICESQTCTRWGSKPWLPPSSMANMNASTGLESHPGVMNTNTNTGAGGGVETYQADTMLIRSPSFEWLPWQSANQLVDLPCSSNAAGYCFNGLFQIGPPPYDHWRSNKPAP